MLLRAAAAGASTAAAAAAEAAAAGGMSFFNRHLIGGFLRFSSAAPAVESPSPKPHFLVEYLVGSCGFPSDEASGVTQRLAHLKSPQNAHSVLCLLRTHGFDNSHLRRLISGHPRFLCHDVNKFLAPRLKALQDLGFSGPDLTKLLLSDPRALNHRTLVRTIDFWRAFLGSDERLMRLFNHKTRFLGTSLENKIMPNLSLLRECGLPDSKIALVAEKCPWIITQRLENLAAAVDRVKRLGIPCSSGMFIWALWVVHRLSEAKFKARMQLMRSLGWSEPEFLSAFQKAPVFLSVSVGTTRKKMDFFVKEAGCEPSDLALHPKLLMYSMEKRLVPRLRVMQILKSRGLHSGKYRLITVMTYTNQAFMEKYVIPHEGKLPQLKDMYVGRGGAL